MGRRRKEAGNQSRPSSSQRAPRSTSESLTPSREAIVHIVREEVRAELFSGPLPHPDTLAGYEQSLAGAADRIFTRWEAQVEHRQKLEDFVIRADTKRSDIGLKCGVALHISSLGVALVLGVRDRELAAAVIGGAGVFGLGATTIVSGITRSQERRRRLQQLMSSGQGG